jgi:transcriptional regulator with XRE-family HTH domain
MDLSTRTGRQEQGQRLQQAVERAGLSIEELAGRVGCSRALIYQYLSGSTLAQPDRLQRIASACGVPLTYFFEDSDSAADAVAAAPEDADNQNVLASLLELASAQESPPDQAALAQTCEKILAVAGADTDLALIAKTCLRLGNACLRLSEYGRAAEMLRRAIAVAREGGFADVEGDAHQSYGHVLVALGSLDDATAEFAAAAQGPNASSQWKGILSSGAVYTMTGEYRLAMQRFDEAADVIESALEDGRLSERDASIGLIYVDGNRINVYMNEGDFQGARPLIQRCMAAAEAYGIAEEHLEARFDLAWCDFHTGNWAAAISALKANAQLARFVGNRSKETLAIAWLGIVYSAAGDTEAGLAAGREALALSQSRSDRRGELYSQLALADAYMGSAHHASEARYHANLALAVAVSLQSERAEAECRLRLAKLSARADKASDLAEHCERALRLAEKLGARHLEAMALCWQGRLDGGVAYAALKLSEELGLVEGVWRAGYAIARNAGGAEGANAAGNACRVLGKLRGQLVEAGLTDTLLEDSDCLGTYRLYVQRLLEEGRAEEAKAALDAADWPPLKAEFSGI